MAESKTNGGHMTQAQRITKLEEDLHTVVWLHAELSYAIRVAMLQQAVTQLLQPQQTDLRGQLQQALMAKLNGAQ